MYVGRIFTEYCDEHVCVSVCVCSFVRDHIFGTTRPIFTSLLRMLPVAVARSSAYSYAVVTRYVFPVLWMTPVNVILTHKLRLLDVAARLRQRGTHAALGFLHVGIPIAGSGRSGLGLFIAFSTY